jgi:hypothetical protein
MKPLLIDFALETEQPKKQFEYQYDFEESLSVVSINNKKKALIDTSNQDLALQTKTKVREESDDYNIDIIDMQTKTRVHQENDDAYYQLVGMAIKTYVKRERDDESSNNLK